MRLGRLLFSLNLASLANWAKRGALICEKDPSLYLSLSLKSIFIATILNPNKALNKGGFEEVSELRR